MNRRCWLILFISIFAVSVLACHSESKPSDITDGDDEISDGDNERVPDGHQPPDGDVIDGDMEIEGEGETDWLDGDKEIEIEGDADLQDVEMEIEKDGDTDLQDVEIEIEKDGDTDLQDVEMEIEGDDDTDLQEVDLSDVETDAKTCLYNNPCAEQASCLWTGEELDCECNLGFEGDPYDECTDIDECAVDNAGCDPLTQCHNEPGNFWCGPCPEEDYTGNADDGCEPILDEHRYRYYIADTELYITIYSNHDLDERREDIERAVIVIHGGGRSPIYYYLGMYDAVRQANVTPNTLIVTPSFMLKADGPGPNEIYWDDNQGWKVGGESTTRYASQVSSFTIIDELIAKVSDRDIFPEMKYILIAGHSGGGQFLARFAAGSVAEDNIDIPFRYAAGNPPSYLYFDNKRPVVGTVDQFAVPVTDCTTYNDYKYGLENLNTYMTNSGPDQIVDRYLGRDVVYMLGGDDIERPRDKSCSGYLQGAHPLGRGNFYFNYLKYYTGSTIHAKVIVPGAQHDSYDIFNSAEGVEAMFGWME